MYSAIYVEEAVRETPRVETLLAQMKNIPVISISHYGEIFNRSNQNFRLQKPLPALILARKHGRKVLPTPEGYGFEGLSGVQNNQVQPSKGFYFSHMMNCIYDCRYCFLQGMYRSANYVLFTNYEDFAEEIETSIAGLAAGQVFYSGYDCDSLALEPVSGFCGYFIPFFARHQEATLEIRTKSTQVRFLLEQEPVPNCVIAMSFSSGSVAEQWEHKVPSIDKRLDALVRLQKAGWPVALRFEPIIAQADTVAQYRELFELIFARLDPARVHSSSLGEFRMPTGFYKKMVKLYPEEVLFAKDVIQSEGMASFSYQTDAMLSELESMLLQHLDADRYYRCA